MQNGKKGSASADNKRYVKGTENLKRIDGEAGEEVMESLKDIAPDIGRYIIEFAFGDIYGRPLLNDCEREMITLSSLLTAGGCENQLKVHIKGALRAGMSKEAVIETFIHCIPYVGFPKVLNAVYTAKKVFNG